MWRLDQALGRWTRVDPGGPDRARPGEVLLVAAADGGYDPETGFDPAVRRTVPDCPVIGAAPGPRPLRRGDGKRGRGGGRDGGRVRGRLGERHATGLGVACSGTARRPASRRGRCWRCCDPGLPAGAAATAVTAAYLHDAGKAHPIWQDALCELAPAERADEITAGRPWAKSGSDKPLRFAGDVPFRHELASLLLVDGPLQSLLDGTPEPDLARYLVLAHHGKLRLQVRDPGDATSGLPPRPAPRRDRAGPRRCSASRAAELTVDLDQFSLGGDRSWTRTRLALRDRYGPFVLAYLETLVRVADWRASAGAEVPTA